MLATIYLTDTCWPADHQPQVRVLGLPLHPLPEVAARCDTAAAAATDSLAWVRLNSRQHTAQCSNRMVTLTRLHTDW